MASKNNHNGKNKAKYSQKADAVKKSVSTTNDVAAPTKAHFFEKDAVSMSFGAEKKDNKENFHRSPDESSFKPHFFDSDTTLIFEDKKKSENNVDNIKEHLGIFNITVMRADSVSELSQSNSEEKSPEKVIDGAEKADEAEKPTVEEKANEAQTLSEILNDTFEKSRTENKKTADDRVGIKELLDGEKKEKTAKAPPAERIEKLVLDNTDRKKADKALKESGVKKAASDHKKGIDKIKKHFEENDSKRKNDALLSSLTEDDIRSEVKEEKKKLLFPFLRYAAMAVCLVVFALSLSDLIGGYLLHKKENEDYDRIINAVNSGEFGYQSIGYLYPDAGSSPDSKLLDGDGKVYTAPEINVSGNKDKYKKILPEIKVLRTEFSDAFAWIKVGGTRIDHPVVSAARVGNDYYLTHRMDGSFSESGTIFTDEFNSRNLSNNRNTCVYGHNMGNQTMFQTLMQFKRRDQFMNSTIEMYTESGMYIYTPFSAYEAMADESFFKTQFASDEEYLAFLDDIKSKAAIKRNDIRLDKNSKIISLITCTNTVLDKRYVVHGVLTEIVRPDWK